MSPKFDGYTNTCVRISIGLMIPKIELTLFIVICLIQIENSNQFMFQIFIKQSKCFDGSGFELPQPIYRRTCDRRGKQSKRTSEGKERSFNIEPKKHFINQ